MHQRTNPPQLLYDKRVVKLCNDCNVDPLIYSNFVLDYLYYEELIPITANNLHLILGIDQSQHLTAKNEFRYKSRIVKDHGDMPTSEYTDEPQNLFIQIFNGTSQNGLINFITENWPIIKRFQKHLKPYPHAKKFEFFKRDVQIYLLHLLSCKPKEIAQIILDENVPDDEGEERDKLEESYSLDEDRIYQIIEDMDKKMQLLIN